MTVLDLEKEGERKYDGKAITRELNTDFKYQCVALIDTYCYVEINYMYLKKIKKQVKI